MSVLSGIKRKFRMTDLFNKGGNSILVRLKSIIFFNFIFNLQEQMKPGLASFAILLLFFPLMMGLSSCRKDKNQISIRGLVSDPNTAIRVEGVLVVLSAKKVTDGVYNAGFAEIARTTTDAGGQFSFDTEEDYVSTYRFAISKSGYFSTMHDISATGITSGEIYTPEYNIYPIGYIQLEVRNFAPFDSADFISYTFSSGYLNCYECCDNSMRYGYGESYSDTLVCKTYGNQSVSITWNVTKNGMTNQHQGTLYSTAFDTAGFQINY
jgi:hypothetical protein